MKTAITISNLSKQYKLASSEPYQSLRDVIVQRVKKLGKKSSRPETFLALKDINLEVKEGERVGIIGHNGAGKSTLLKIISRITPPTKGKITLNGRVASLLEVGTGFHPELTGRENIYLNGSILGLKKIEIDRKLDEIIDFSGVEKFIDTPLKHFSSGMQLRLAFSVAAHLEPEVLLIDEVLAVGDMEFQKKCIGKMEEISRESGRTILFVSHNMAAVKQLCDKALLLKNGRSLFFGSTDETTALYLNNIVDTIKQIENAAYDLRNHPNKRRTDEGLFSVQMFVNGIQTIYFLPGSELKLSLRYFLKTDLIDPDVGIIIKDAKHNALIGLNNKHIGKKISLKKDAEGTVTILIPQLNLFRPGKYKVDLFFGDYYHFYECLYECFEFIIEEFDVYKTGKQLDPVWNNIFIPKLDIRTE